MSENFELMQHPFHHGLNLSSSQQAHVAQQIRRDKLRIAPHISPSPPSGINPNFIIPSQEIEESRYTGISRSGYSELPGIASRMPLQDPHGMISSEMMINYRSTSEFPPVKEGDIVQIDHNGWKNINSQSNTDYLINYLQNQGTQNPVVSSTVLDPVGGGGFPIYNPCALSSVPVMNQGGQKSSTEFPCVLSGPMQHNSEHQSQILTHTPQAIKIREQSQGPLVPSFGNLQTGQSGFCEWNPRQGDLRTRNWNDGSLEGGSKTDPTGQGLSLSLSFHNPQELHLQPYETRFASQNFAPTTDNSFHSMGRYHEKQKEGCVGGSGDCFSLPKEGTHFLSGATVTAGIQRNPEPLRPFTGYASVLKNSNFLKPAQQLLDEYCNVDRMKMVLGASVEGDAGKFLAPKRPVDVDGSCGVSGAFCDPLAATMANPACISSTSSALPSANMTADPGVEEPSSSSADSNKHRRKKTRLMSMLDEVCRRYRHYYQQLQMVVTSFESVAGLSTAAPYISMALKAMTKHFRCLKNAINDQLKFTCKRLGEDCFSPGTSGRDQISGLRLEEENRGNSEGLSVGESPPPPPHVWRPQRGLPERAVAVLRAWLFEHFLHPYPTDTDKQILAKQTGLTRNQVSNWFINARVRLWKPMVEEIHSLETRGSSLKEGNSARKPESAMTAAEECSERRNHQGQLTLDIHPANTKQQQETCTYNDGNSSGTLHNVVQSTKRSRADFPPTLTGNDCSSGGASYQSNELYSNVAHFRAGVGGVSLTLGLRHNDQARHRLGLEDHHDGHNHNTQSDTNEMYAVGGLEGQSMQIRNHIGGQLLHDFVG